MKHVRTAVAAAVACAVAGAHAQTADAGDAGVITITAQKRREDLRKVPLSVTVISGEALEESHVVNFVDLSTAVPNLSYSTQAGAGLSTLQIRGISSQAGTATVAIYLDDVSLTTRNLYSQGTAEPRFFDLERVEVLRGPQGTLYGASSLGGTLRFISKQPDATRLGGDAYAEVSHTERGGTNHMVYGVVNAPLVKDVLALRVGVQHGRDSGTIDQVSPTTLQVVNHDINSNEWNVAKAALRAQLGRDWTLTPSVFYQRFRMHDIDAQYTAVGDYQSANVGAPLAKFQTSKIVREPGRDKLVVPSATLEGGLGFADLTAIVSGYRRDFDRTQDGTSINSPYIGSVVTDPALGQIVGFLPSQVNLDNRVRQTSAELRLASKDYVPGGIPFTWLVGGYAARTKTEVVDDEPVLGINAAFRAAGQDIEDPAAIADTFPGAFLNDSSYFSARHYRDRQASLFGELAWYALPTLRVRGGVRVLRAKQDFDREGDRYYAGGPVTASIDSKYHATTPRFAVDWDATATDTVFVNIAKGFRLGSANRPVPLTPLVLQDLADQQLPPTIPASFKSDSLWSYEVGTKSRFAGGRVTLNATAFYIDWKNIQQDVTLSNSGFDFETNVGKARSYGVELETRVRATESLTLQAQGGWTHATFAEDVPALGLADGGGLNVEKGDRVQGVPRWNAGVGFDQRVMVGGVAGFVRGTVRHVASSRGSLFADSSDYKRPAYTTADASLGVTIDRFEVSAFVKNLFDNDKAIQHPDIQGVSTVYRLRPRTFGLTGRYDF